MRKQFDMQQINLLRITKTISSISKYFNQENENTPKKKRTGNEKKISGRLQISLLILGEFKQINLFFPRNFQGEQKLITSPEFT